MYKTIFLCILIVVVFIIYIYRHITRNFKIWKDLHVPYLAPVPIFGNVYRVAALKQSLGQFAKEVYDYKNSRFTGFFVFDQPFLMIRDPDLIKAVLIKDFEYFSDRTVFENRPNDEIGANLLFVIKNPAWRPIRVKLTPVFTSGKIKNMLHLMLEVAKDLKGYIDNMVETTNGLIESREMTMKYTTDVISSCAFGINSHSFKHEDAEFRVAARRFFKFSLSRAIQISAYFVAPVLVRMFGMKFMEPKSSNFMCTIFWKHMNQRILSNSTRNDLIDILLKMKENSNDALDGEILVAQALQFFLAGFETTGSTISFTLYELAINQDVQKRLRNEVKQTLEKHGELSYDAIMEMKYLDNIISETLRKYPPLTFLDRRCSKTYTIPNSSVKVQEGLPVYISLLGLHMDPQYFPEPEVYNPERFSDENKESIQPFTYLPFGEGPRNCIGARFGLVSAKIALITVFANFVVEAHSSTEIPMQFDTKSGFLIAPKNGVIYLSFKKCA